VRQRLRMHTEDLPTHRTAHRRARDPDGPQVRVERVGLDSRGQHDLHHEMQCNTSYGGVKVSYASRQSASFDQRTHVSAEAPRLRQLRSGRQSSARTGAVRR
jgi:hypothetical protein